MAGRYRYRPLALTRPQTVRVEVFVVQMYRRLQTIVTIVFDLMTILICRDEDCRQVVSWVKSPKTPSPSGELRLRRPGNDLLGRFQRGLELRALLRADVCQGAH